jgi:hypothetical protein
MLCVFLMRPAGDEVTRENKVRFELDGGKYPGASPQ